MGATGVIMDGMDPIVRGWYEKLTEYLEQEIWDLQHPPWIMDEHKKNKNGVILSMSGQYLDLGDGFNSRPGYEAGVSE